MSEIEMANGCAKAPRGTWLAAADQPAASLGSVRLRGQKGFVVPDRAALRVVESEGEIWLSSSDRPFLTRLDAPPDEAVAVVSAKVLVAPVESRTGARNVRLVPFSFGRSTVVTAFRGGWVVTATRGRVTRVAVEDGATFAVRPEALVAWVGKDPTGFCPKLGLMDIILPRGPKNLSFNFHGPCVVWFEGASVPVRGIRRTGVW